MGKCKGINSVEVTEIRNSVDICLFPVTSEYFMMTQFQSYRHDTKVSGVLVDGDNN